RAPRSHLAPGASTVSLMIRLRDVATRSPGVTARARSTVLGPPREELAAQQLARRALRQRRHELVAARALEVREVRRLAPEGVEVVGAERRGRPRARHDERGDDLPPARVGQAHHAGLAHPRMAQEDLLDLDRVDVLAAGDDHVVDPTHREDVTLLVLVGEVA